MNGLGRKHSIVRVSVCALRKEGEVRTESESLQEKCMVGAFPAVFWSKISFETRKRRVFFLFFIIIIIRFCK